MTQEEINERNVAIANFMGWVKPDLRTKERFRTDIPEQFLFLGEDEDKDGYPLYAKGLHFHVRWDWIMPIVEKILHHKGGNYYKQEDKSFNIHHFDLDPRFVFISGSINPSTEHSQHFVSRQFMGDEDFKDTASSFLEMIWLAVSDFCLEWVKHQPT